MTRYPGQPVWFLTCYGEEVAEYPDLEAATTAGAAHIVTCPQGAMPWATEIEWRFADQLGSYCAAAGGEWLNHHLDPKADGPAR
jgi:hypothetical protein